MQKASVARARTTYGWDVVMRRYSDLICERSALSRKSSIKPAAKRAPFLPAFFSASKHFATSILEDDTRLIPTEVGIMPPQQSEEFRRHFADMEACCPDEPAALLRELSPLGTFGECGDRVSKRMSCSRSEADRYIMWMIKYGYLAVA